VLKTVLYAVMIKTKLPDGTGALPALGDLPLSVFR
jgi:hypothetical protein